MTELFQYRLPLKNGTWRDGIIVRIGDGLGDIAPLPGFSQETFLEAKEEALRAARQEIEPTLPSVRFAFDCAKQPFPPSLKTPVGSLNEPKQGFRSLKLKLGHLSLEDALDLLKRTPKHIELRLDFNRAWPLKKLLDFAAHFSPHDFAYLEEPTHKFSDLLAFSRLTEMPIAVDESIPDVPYWEIPTLKALIVKPTILGKVPEKPSNAELIFSSAYESGVGILHIAKLAEKHNPHRPHGLDPYSHLLEDLIDPAPTLERGFLCWQANGTPALKHGSLLRLT